MKWLYMIMVLGLLPACSRIPERKDEKPVARVFDSYLYVSDIREVVPTGITSADSASLVRDFIEKWVRNQLLLNKAEDNLTEPEKDVDLQIENYRSSLLIYAYQQSYLRQHLDTIVSDKEISDYYNENQSNFILNETLMKGHFIKVRSDAPELYKLRQWYRADDTASVRKLDAYCYQYATVYDDFGEEWVNFNDVLQMIPTLAPWQETAFQLRKSLESSDNEYLYFVFAKELASQGTVSPLSSVKNNIQYIILNKRKINIINDLESNIYTDAQNREYFTIYQ